MTRDDLIEAMQFDFGPVSVLHDGDAPAVLTYAFHDGAPAGPSLVGGFAGWRPFTGAERAAARDAMAEIETFANVRFVEVAATADPIIDLGKVAVAGGTAGRGGVAWSWRGTELEGYESFAVFDAHVDLTLQQGLLRHELGHALGLGHPFDHPAMPERYDNNGYTVMSYTADPAGKGVGETYEVLDIMALQDLWGANPDAAAASGPLLLRDVAGGSLAVVDGSMNLGAIEAGDTGADARIDLRQGAYSYVGGDAVALMALDASVATAIGGAGDDRLDGGSGPEKLVGRLGADTIVGRGGDDVLRGGGGTDRLDGGADDDRLIGGRGDDRIDGGRGADAARGGRGQDEIAGGGGRDRLLGGGGGDEIEGNRGHDVLDGQGGADVLRGGGGRDRIAGGAHADTLHGGPGADAIRGGAGRDLLHGERGRDTLEGGAGGDRLFGGAGADELDGGRGRDVLVGGAGADTFRFAPGGGRDVIRDFGRGDDTLVLTGFGSGRDVLREAEEARGDVVLDLDGGTLILRGTTLAAVEDGLLIG